MMKNKAIKLLNLQMILYKYVDYLELMCINVQPKEKLFGFLTYTRKWHIDKTRRKKKDGTIL